MKKSHSELLREVGQTPTSPVNNDHVLIVDGLNLFLRNWTANPTMNDDGEPFGGVIGSLKSIGATIRLFSPTRVIIVFDGKDGSSKRKKLFEGYKDDRGDNNKLRINRQYKDMLTEDEEMQLLRTQFIALVDILDSFPVSTIIFDGVEADDVIAYIATSVAPAESTVTIVSADKDFLQLVDENIHVYSPIKKTLYYPKSVYEEYGIHPFNLLLYRTLDGDVSDNIPGVRGCGLKTITKFIPEICGDVPLSVDDVLDIAKDRVGKIKLYQTILDSEDIIRRNWEIMQLSDSLISPYDRIRIVSRFNEAVQPSNSLDVIRTFKKYKILNNWPNILDWLHDTFKLL
jgi:DNA polymerase-1